MTSTEDEMWDDAERDKQRKERLLEQSAGDLKEVQEAKTAAAQKGTYLPAEKSLASERRFVEGLGVQTEVRR